MRRRISDFVYRRTGRVLDLERVSSDPDLQAMVALLLAGMADADGAITDDEFERIVGLMRGFFGLNENVSLDLFMKAVDELRKREDLSMIMDELKPRLDLRRKEDLLVILLKVIAADGEKHPKEMAYLQRFAGRIGIPDDVTERAFERYAGERRSVGRTA